MSAPWSTRSALKGQIHGGVAQGLGQALMEQVVYDREFGPDADRQLYGLRMPRADDLADHR